MQKELEVDIAMIDKKISEIFLDKKATTIQEAKQLRQKIYMLEQKREELIAELEQLHLQHKTRELYLDRNIDSLLVNMRLLIIIFAILGVNL